MFAARRCTRQSRWVMTEIANDEDDCKTTARPRAKCRRQQEEDNEKKANSCLSSRDKSKNKTQTREWGKLAYLFRVTKTGLYTKASPA